MFLTKEQCVVEKKTSFLSSGLPISFWMHETKDTNGQIPRIRFEIFLYKIKRQYGLQIVVSISFGMHRGQHPEPDGRTGYSRGKGGAALARRERGGTSA